MENRLSLVILFILEDVLMVNYNIQMVWYIHIIVEV